MPHSQQKGQPMKFIGHLIALFSVAFTVTILALAPWMLR